MTSEWSVLPLLPLRCVLQHLSTEDALAAMSTCRHWRNAMLLYEGRKEKLILRAKHLEKSMFVSRIFKRHTRKLRIYLDCSEQEIERFINLVLPQFFDTANLQELIFIAAYYIHPHLQVQPFVKLKRILTETLVFKHMHSIKRLALLGCSISTFKDDHDMCTHENTEYYSRPLKFGKVDTAADALLSSCNVSLMVFSTLKHIIVDYEHVHTATLQTLSHLVNLTHLTLNISCTRNCELHAIDWFKLQQFYTTPLQVGVNIIAVPYTKFNDIIENVLVEGLNLISLKVLFCKSLYGPLVSHVTRAHRATLRELVWADAPHTSGDQYQRIVRPLPHSQDNYTNDNENQHLNPFVLLCWQCEHLQRLALHGYWLWQYDLLGFARLGKGLTRLEVSTIYNKQDMFDDFLCYSEECMVRVLVRDEPPGVDANDIAEINEYTNFRWKPLLWSEIHPGLRARATKQERVDYIVSEILMPATLKN